MTKFTFESILKRDNNWSDFKQYYEHLFPSNTIREVEKMLKCGSSECGFATYVCNHCGESFSIPFTCKSKLCTRCGKKYTDLWAHSTSQKLLNCDHRHIVFTIPDKLWPFFHQSRTPPESPLEHSR